MRKIGIVVSQVPGRSETFLRSKISGLIGEGFRVVLFAGRKVDGEFDLCPIVYAYRVPEGFLQRAVFTAFVISGLAIRSPHRFFRFCKIERRVGEKWSKIIRRAYASAHILPHSVDHLHFSFATLGVGKESLGVVMRTCISTSLRGFDVCIYPLTRPAVYARLWQALDKVHTISDDLFHEAVSQGLPKTVPCVKIRPAIDTRSFRHRREWQDVVGSLKILTVARLEWKKGLEVALDAMSILKRRGVMFHYTVVGMGAERDRLQFAQLQLGLGDDVTFAGWKTPEEISALMKDSHIYVQPSVQEGFCNAVLEAQSSGLMCVVTDAEGLQENVVDGVTGWVVPRWDPAALAERIVAIRDMSKTEKDMVSARATQRVSSEFDLADQRKQFAEFFTAC